MVSCGRDNVRLWRVRGGALRSCPVNLGEYHSMDFTDVAFEEGQRSHGDQEDRSLSVNEHISQNTEAFFSPHTVTNTSS